VLETAARDGRGRLADWTPCEGLSVRSPELIVPTVGLVDVPAWARVVVTQAPAGRAGVVELVSGGTWFHPVDAEGLVVAAPQPGPTGQVQVLRVGEELAVFHDAGGWASNPTSAVPSLIEARRQATPGRLLWAPALGSPADYALWTYLGADLFDASPLLLAATRGQALTVDGPLPLEDAERLLGDGEEWDVQRLAQHNLEAARRELALVRHHIARGALRALVERRVYAAPSSVEILRRFDREHAHLEAAAATNRGGPLACMTGESLWMPEVERFRRRVRDHYEPPAQPDILVLLPCSRTKPYKLSPSHRHMQRALDESGIRHRVHEVMVTSPLGIVPRELEDVFPANAYDVPVTGRWTLDEGQVIRDQLAALLARRTYRHVISHVDAHTQEVIAPVLPEGALHTAEGRPASFGDCVRLRDALRQVQEADPAGKDVRALGKARKLDDLRALASFQFGPEAARALTRSAFCHGRMPYVKLEEEGTGKQLGMTTAERGTISLTLEGAARIAGIEGYRVRIQDFELKGTSSLFAVGVEGADADVRPGDEVVVLCGEEVRGVGVAQMAAEEMGVMRRGIAVTVRHTARRGEAGT